jgi:hypothetical protein
LQYPRALPTQKSHQCSAGYLRNQRHKINLIINLKSLKSYKLTQLIWIRGRGLQLNIFSQCPALIMRTTLISH